MIDDFYIYLIGLVVGTLIGGLYNYASYFSYATISSIIAIGTYMIIERVNK